MTHIRWLFILLVLLLLLAGCASAALSAGQPVAMAQPPAAVAEATPTAVMVFAPPDATVTPTPFQPLPPTEVFWPTATPLPTATPPPPTPTLQPFFPNPAAVTHRGLEEPEGQTTILLLGSDKRPWDTIFRTDTIILAVINPDAGTVNLVSFPRDLYVNIPGWGYQRINTAYQHGGFDLLAQTLESNFGVRPDHYVLINFSSFKRIIDSLGGLDVEVAESVSDYKDGYWTTVPAGTVHMDADLVLWYVRTRKTSNDFARSRRQQEVLNALLDKFLSMDAIKKAPEFYLIYKDTVSTDLGFPDLVRMLPAAAKVTDRSHLRHYYIGPQQVYDWITPDGGMVLMPQQEAIMEVLREALNIP